MYFENLSKTADIWQFVDYRQKVVKYLKCVWRLKKKIIKIAIFIFVKLFFSTIVQSDFLKFQITLRILSANRMVQTGDSWIVSPVLDTIDILRWAIFKSNKEFKICCFRIVTTCSAIIAINHKQNSYSAPKITNVSSDFLAHVKQLKCPSITNLGIIFSPAQHRAFRYCWHSVTWTLFLILDPCFTTHTLSQRLHIIFRQLINFSSQYCSLVPARCPPTQRERVPPPPSSAWCDRFLQLHLWMMCSMKLRKKNLKKITV